MFIILHVKLTPDMTYSMKILRKISPAWETVYRENNSAPKGKLIFISPRKKSFQRSHLVTDDKPKLRLSS